MSAISRKRGYFGAKYSRKSEKKEKRKKKGVISGELGHTFLVIRRNRGINQVYFCYKVIKCLQKQITRKKTVQVITAWSDTSREKGTSP